MANNYFKWDDDFNTGYQDVDDQHFKLVDMINKLLEMSVSRQKLTIENLQIISQDLKDYVVEHFATEEELMQNYHIDTRHTKDHIRDHYDFIRSVEKNFSNLNKLLNTRKLSQVVEYLIRWLAYHILNTDKSLIRQYKHIIEKNLTPKQAYDKEEQYVERSTEPLLKAVKVLYLLVSKKNKEIEKKNEELEEKVKERTEELLKANQQLNELLYHDTLTKLPNRRFVMNELQKLIDLWERYTTPFSVLFIDVDKFKTVNDEYGHDKGDELLINISNFLSRNIRKTDTACRLSGDEFIIICPNTTLEGAEIIGLKLNPLIQEQCQHELKLWKPSLSVGISSMKNALKSPSDILKEADSAMYTVKSKGGGHVYIINESE